jgi:DNA-binding winged helix-turn-helix (wHTH) protein/tetratricopeptide (TPR) repeat protein
MPAGVCRFEDFELDPSAYWLRRKGRIVRLERIPFRLLCLLVERRGQLVTREEILEQIWGKGIFISENSINTAVRKIRRALNDDADAPRFIVTVPSGGYRFEAIIRAASVTPAQSRLLRGAFIGRNMEMAKLRAGLADAAAGHGRLFLISGQPGIGKTRLVRELAATAEASGMRVLAGQCSEHDEAVPYLPFVEILESYAERASGPDVLRTVLGDEGPELARLLPKLNRTLPDLPPPIELPPQQARRHLFNCFCDFVARLAKEQPTLLILEDLHWADDSTLALLSHLSQRLSRLPLLVAGTYRDTELNVTSDLARTLENLLRGRLATALTLAGLRNEEVADMLSSLSGQTPPTAIAAEFYRETEGNPFFVEELFRHLEEENRLYDSDGIFHTEVGVAELEVPRSVRLVVGRRLARLSDRTRRTLGTAATIGRLFSFELLKASTKADASSLLESVEEAERAGLVLSSADSPTARFEFSHELVRQAVVGALSAARRQRLHLEVAQAIERVYSHALEDYYGELAHHYGRSDNIAKAVEYLGRTGASAAERMAHSEAISYLTRAAELLRRLPAGAGRDSLELDLQMALSWSSFVARGPRAPQRESTLVRARELCEQLGENSKLMEVLLALAHTRIWRDIGLGRELAEKVLAMVQQANAQGMLAGAHSVLGLALFSAGQFPAARQHLDRAVDRFGLGPYRNHGVFFAQNAPNMLVDTLIILGYPLTALGKGCELLTAARRSSDPYSVAIALFFDGLRHVELRDTLAIAEQADELLSITTEHGMAFYSTAAAFFRGWAAAAAGRVEVGIAEMRRSISDPMLSEALPSTLMLGALAETCGKNGRAEEGLDLVAKGLATTEQTGLRTQEAELHRIKGDLLMIRDLGKVAEAERCLRTAIDTARRQCARLFELRATVSLARLLKQQDETVEARQMLAEIYNWFTEGFDTRDLKDAKALLDELDQ